MKKLTNDEIIGMLQQTLIYKRTPEEMRPLLLTEIMDLGQEIQDAMIEMNKKKPAPKSDFYSRGEEMWKRLGLDKA